jgi:hypothetical protein
MFRRRTASRCIPNPAVLKEKTGIGIRVLVFSQPSNVADERFQTLKSAMPPRWLRLQPCYSQSSKK